jgi:DNA-binding transcriptional ArsR family regulator
VIDRPGRDARLETEVDLLHAHVCQALADPKRILILYALADAPRYVGELSDDLHLPQPTVSRHLGVLRQQFMVTTERSGSSVRYSLADHRVIDALDLLRGLLMDGLAQQAQLAQAFSSLPTAPVASSDAAEDAPRDVRTTPDASEPETPVTPH